MTITAWLLVGVIVSLLIIGSQLGTLARNVRRLRRTLEHDIAEPLAQMQESLSEIQASFPRPIDRALNHIRRESEERTARQPPQVTR